MVDKTHITGGTVAGYVLANVSWTSAEGRQAYLDLLGPTLEAHGGTVTCRSRDVHVMEGDWHPEGVVVLISFPALKDALAWYDSEEYRLARDVRQQSSSGSQLLIFGE
jgi:uncharacterized protein (DUF1330 family)